MIFNMKTSKMKKIKIMRVITKKTNIDVIIVIVIILYDSIKLNKKDFQPKKKRFIFRGKKG